MVLPFTCLGDGYHCLDRIIIIKLYVDGDWKKPACLLYFSYVACVHENIMSCDVFFTLFGTEDDVGTKSIYEY